MSGCGACTAISGALPRRSEYSDVISGSDEVIERGGTAGAVGRADTGGAIGCGGSGGSGCAACCRIAVAGVLPSGICSCSPCGIGADGSALGGRTAPVDKLACSGWSPLCSAERTAWYTASNTGFSLTNRTSILAGCTLASTTSAGRSMLSTQAGNLPTIMLPLNACSSAAIAVRVLT